MKKIIVPLLVAASTFALAQGPGGGPGPGPQPNPWVQVGSTISFGGCLTVPSTISGGCKGAGTGNFAGLYQNGLAVPTSVFGRTGNVVGALGDYSFGLITGTAAVTQGGTGLTGGTSGGVPYYSGSAVMASSAVLSANQLVLGGGTGGAPATLGSLGSTTTVLHGNASGAPTWASVVLTTDVSGILPGANGGTGVANTGMTITVGANLTTTGGATTLAFGATGRTYTFPDTTGTIADLTSTQTFSGKALSGSANTFTAIPLSAFTNLGSATTVLHGNASGSPTFGAVNLATDVSGILPGANGGTSNSFFAVSGPATSLKTFTFPNASANVLTDNAVVTGAQGGTGIANTGETLTLGASFTINGGGTLSVASGKSLTASNTLTLTATDGSTLAIGAGGTLGSNAYTSTAYAPLAGPTFTGVLTAPNITISTLTGTQCLQEISGVISGSGAPCAASVAGTILYTNTGSMGSWAPTCGSPGCMGGYGSSWSFIAPSSGKVIIHLDATIGASNIAQTHEWWIVYGTGTAPSQNASPVGTKCTTSPSGFLFNENVGALNPVHDAHGTCVVTGLTGGTTYWVDGQYLAGGTGSFQPSSINVVAAQ